MYSPFFTALTRITRLDFEARSGAGSRMGWNHRGSGSVAVSVDGRDVHFVDRFVLDNGMPFEDRKCWRFTDEGIIFRHYRQQQFQDILLMTFDAERLEHDQIETIGLDVFPAEKADSGIAAHVNSDAEQTMRKATMQDSSSARCVMRGSPDANAAATAHAIAATKSAAHLMLQAQAPYLCPPDRYDGSLLLHPNGRVVLRLRIQGTRKDERIRYTYLPANVD